MLDRQIAYLTAIAATSAVGTPPFVSLVRQAVDEFIERQLAKPGVRSQVETYLRENRTVVNLRKV